VHDWCLIGISQRGGKPLNKREKDKCEMQAHATVAEEDERPRPTASPTATSSSESEGPDRVVDFTVLTRAFRSPYHLLIVVDYSNILRAAHRRGPFLTVKFSVFLGEIPIWAPPGGLSSSLWTSTAIVKFNIKHKSKVYFTFLSMFIDHRHLLYEQF